MTTLVTNIGELVTWDTARPILHDVTFQVRAGCFSSGSCDGTVAFTLSGP